MPALREWIPTTTEIIEVTNEPTKLLERNRNVRVRMVVPLTRKLVMLGLGEDECRGPAATFNRPWRETAVDRNDLMFRDDLYARHQGSDELVIRVFVMEGEER